MPLVYHTIVALEDFAGPANGLRALTQFTRVPFKGAASLSSGRCDLFGYFLRSIGVLSIAQQRQTDTPGVSGIWRRLHTASGHLSPRTGTTQSNKPPPFVVAFYLPSMKVTITCLCGCARQEGNPGCRSSPHQGLPLSLRYVSIGIGHVMHRLSWPC